MKGKKRKMGIIIGTVIIAAVVLTVWIAWGNTALMLTKVTVKNESIPKGFNGYNIAQISDLHNCDLDNGNKKMVDMLKNAAPDIIVITGDMLDTRRPGHQHSLAFVEKAVKIAPCYFVPGNHEAKSAEYTALRNGMIKAGAVIVEDGSVMLSKNNDTVTLYGICDPLFRTETLTGNSATVTEKRLQAFLTNDNEYDILLAHRPELIDIYAEHKFDLVLSGHAHGGQFRLPFIGGILAPNQGLFPKYDSGLYTKDKTNMIVSRGIGKSVIPFRINNRPEVILIELKTVENKKD